jgi:hypothetical protein
LFIVQCLIDSVHKIVITYRNYYRQAIGIDLEVRVLFLQDCALLCSLITFRF